MRISDWISDLCSSDLGAGGADKWGPAGTNTGWTCWKCGGTGVSGKDYIRLYTAEENVKHDAAAEKRAAKKAEKMAERQEQSRVGEECVRKGRSRWFV